VNPFSHLSSGGSIWKIDLVCFYKIYLMLFLSLVSAHRAHAVDGGRRYPSFTQPAHPHSWAFGASSAELLTATAEEPARRFGLLWNKRGLAAAGAGATRRRPVAWVLSPGQGEHTSRSIRRGGCVKKRLDREGTNCPSTRTSRPKHRVATQGVAGTRALGSSLGSGGRCTPRSRGTADLALATLHNAPRRHAPTAGRAVAPLYHEPPVNTS